MSQKKLGGVVGKSSKILNAKAAFGPFLYKYPTKPSTAVKMLTKFFNGVAWGVGFAFCMKALGLKYRFDVVRNESISGTVHDAIHL